MGAAAPPLHLDFPAGAPGRCGGCSDCTQNPPPAVSTRGVVAPGTPQFFEHFTLQDSTGANVDIYFQMDGHQPTTQEAAQWSCANVDANNLVSPITQWYVDAFFTHNFGFNPISVVPGFLVPQTPGQIITVVVTVTDAGIEQIIKDAFQVIAANPVGRVLLYRLLIEIGRCVTIGNNKYGWCESLTIFDDTLNQRNNGRLIGILSCPGNENGFQRLPNSSWIINFDLSDNDSNFIQIGGNQLSMNSGEDDLDIGLFHEMLHWFQFLRHPARFFGEGIGACTPSRYMYLSRCYYGNISEQFTWGGLDHQEMRTILGTPNYNTPTEVDLFHPDALLQNAPNFLAATNTNGATGFLPPGCAFYEGDDLSENAYRMARHIVDPDNHPVRMRFGHGDPMEPVDINEGIPWRFQLANLVARNCCNAIVSANGGPPIDNWNLVPGEAAAAQEEAAAAATE